MSSSGPSPEPKLPPDLPGFAFVDQVDDLARVVGGITRARAVAVDTEADSMHCFFEKTCLVQLATEVGSAWVVDPLALRQIEGLAECFGAADVRKVFHGADFDVMSLRRDFGFRFRNIFDTMVASQLLGDERLSLRDLVERFFGVHLDKAYTRCDWGRRPLDDKQLEYCYLDVAYLVQLMEIQESRLAEADLLEEAQIEFDRLALREHTPREFDPWDWLRIKGSRELGGAQQAALHGMFVVRDRHGRRMDRPVFKVVSNDTMLRIAQRMPETLDDLRRVKGVSDYVVGRMGKELVDAIRDGAQAGHAPPRPRPPLDPLRKMDVHGQRRLGLLKDWRNVASQRTKRTTLAILPNYAMFEVARLRPHTEDELAAIAGVGTKRAALWGVEILPLL